MTTPYPGSQHAAGSASPANTPRPVGRPRTNTAGGAKRGRKPKGFTPSVQFETSPTATHESAPSPGQSPTMPWTETGASVIPSSTASQIADVLSQATQGGAPSTSGAGPSGLILPIGSSSGSIPLGAGSKAPAAEEEGEADDEVLPAMADDDYSAQLSWQSQSKDNLKVLMDNFSPEQYDRYEAYRRHALPKAAVRKVVQQSLGQQVSMPVAQIVAGFSKVFVGEVIEKARAVQARRGESGPLSPDHLREAYHLYQLETGRVGSARPLKSKRLFRR